MPSITKRQLNKKILELSQAIQKLSIVEAQRLLKSGAIDLENVKDDFETPKIILQAATRAALSAYRPLYPDNQKLAKNLEKI